MPDKQKFNWQGITLTYTIIGEGPERILAFHGFGQDSSVYQSWADALGKLSTIYSLDLFFHGSEWPFHDIPLTSARVKDLFGAFMEENNIRRFSLLTYSIGTRLGFEIMKIWPDRIDRAYLIAPDGIKLNFWYRLVTGFLPARRLFRYTVYRPGIFMKILEWTGKLKLIPPSTGRFALSQMRNMEKREKVYLTWMIFRSFRSPVHQMISLINNQDIELLAFAGEQDSIIPLKPVGKFVQKIKRGRLVVLPVGHHQLMDASAEWIRDHPSLL